MSSIEIKTAQALQALGVSEERADRLEKVGEKWILYSYSEPDRVLQEFDDEDQARRAHKALKEKQARLRDYPHGRNARSESGTYRPHRPRR